MNHEWVVRRVVVVLIVCAHATASAQSIDFTGDFGGIEVPDVVDTDLALLDDGDEPEVDLFSLTPAYFTDDGLDIYGVELSAKLVNSGKKKVDFRYQVIDPDSADSIKDLRLRYTQFAKGWVTGEKLFFRVAYSDREDSFEQITPQLIFADSMPGSQFEWSLVAGWIYRDFDAGSSENDFALSTGVGYKASEDVTLGLGYDSSTKFGDDSATASLTWKSQAGTSRLFIIEKGIVGVTFQATF